MNIGGEGRAPQLVALTMLYSHAGSLEKHGGRHRAGLPHMELWRVVRIVLWRGMGWRCPRGRSGSWWGRPGWGYVRSPWRGASQQLRDSLLRCKTVALPCPRCLRLRRGR